jgi:hypothetical protein
MASRKYLKKALNNMVFDIVEECFTIQILDESKTKEAFKEVLAHLLSNDFSDDETK